MYVAGEVVIAVLSAFILAFMGGFAKHLYRRICRSQGQMRNTVGDIRPMQKVVIEEDAYGSGRLLLARSLSDSSGGGESVWQRAPYDNPPFSLPL